MEKKEGEVAKKITAFGKTFILYYGYYSESEKRKGTVGLLPIYPDFLNQPTYTDEGFPFVTQMQDGCKYLLPLSADGDCFSCRHYRQGEDLIGICACEKNRRTNKS
ncbi:MAG: hypothetical protein J6K61_03820 [Clostridia bacterium]|nr:hypothetical protein [Clostridia bacterium]